ncbi:Rho GTPase-activating protein 44 [Amphibalanus amphitrite]|uniref:Rho GTPase-activating protein 44 n=1 Tax=Amphibalanus amphitrite TaxID=1232801 RepID=A0A6A4WQA4_AMPAM|nr:Rho GTPase-activating protein 44 [Amphibalanus amphitrite]
MGHMKPNSAEPLDAEDQARRRRRAAASSDDDWLAAFARDLSDSWYSDLPPKLDAGGVSTSNANKKSTFIRLFSHRRKMQEHQLGAAMKEGAGHVGAETMLGAIMSECGEAQLRLAGERLDYERALEQTVLENSVLQQLLDTDIPNVTKLRKTLAKLTLDMDASRSRYQNAQRHSAGQVGAAGSQQKVEATRDELEAAQVKVEQHRDTLAGDMFQLLSREPELAQLLLHLVKLQTEYYRSSLQLLEGTIPALQASLNAAAVKPVFGLSLEEHLRVSGRQVALPLEMCICRLLQIGADEEGLFRVAGSTSKARKLKSCFDAGLASPEHMHEYLDAHVVADALKAYLRDLPEPLMTTDFYDDWMAAAHVQDEGQRLQALWQVLHQLPETHYTNLRYLIKFLALLSKNKQVNKMTTQNIAIVMAPNLLWTRLEEGFNMTATGTHSLVVDSLIQHSDWFFPEEVDFFITYPREEPAEVPPPAPAPDSPVLSNGSVRSSPGHHRSKSSDSGVVAVDSSGVGESASGSTASLTSSDPSRRASANRLGGTGGGGGGGRAPPPPPAHDPPTDGASPRAGPSRSRCHSDSGYHTSVTSYDILMTSRQ